MNLRPNGALLAEADRERLNALLRDPLVVTAINIAIREAQPDAVRLAKLPPEQQAAVANQLAGMTDLVSRLESLSAPVVDLKSLESPLDEEFSHYEHESDPTQ